MLALNTTPDTTVGECSYPYSKYILQMLLVNLITDRFVLPCVTEETHAVDPFTGDEP